MVTPLKTMAADPLAYARGYKSIRRLHGLWWAAAHGHSLTGAALFETVVLGQNRDLRERKNQGE